MTSVERSKPIILPPAVIAIDPIIFTPAVGAAEVTFPELPDLTLIFENGLI